LVVPTPVLVVFEVVRLGERRLAERARHRDHRALALGRRPSSALESLWSFSGFLTVVVSWPVAWWRRPGAFPGTSFPLRSDHRFCPSPVVIPTVWSYSSVPSVRNDRT
jgi:hypothetical protein